MAGKPGPTPGVAATATATAQIDAYLAALPPDQRAVLQTLRKTIAAAAPEAEEALSYGVPAFDTAGGRSSRTWRPRPTARSTP